MYVEVKVKVCKKVTASVENKIYLRFQLRKIETLTCFLFEVFFLLEALFIKSLLRIHVGSSCVLKGYRF